MKTKKIILLIILIIIILIIYNYNYILKEKYKNCPKECNNNDECAIGLTCINKCCI